MRFSCEHCGRSYVASDEVAGRAFRMRCKQCGNDVVVRPSRDLGPFASPLPASPSPPPSPGADGAQAVTRDGAQAVTQEERPAADGERFRRPSFDPFEGEDLPAGDLAVSSEALEILDRTPPARPLPRPAVPARTASATPAPRPSATPAATRAPALQRARVGRMLPAEDEAMLGPPGAEDRRTVPRWAILLVFVAVAAGLGVAFLR